MATDTKSEKDTSKTADKADDKTVAGTDKSKTTETTKQAAERDTTPEVTKVETSDPEAAATGGVEGAVVDGDNGLTDDEYDALFAAADGSTVERDVDGEEFDVPFTRVVGGDLARTSDSDDPAKSWTAQEAAEERKDEDDETLDTVALTEVVGTPGQTFRARELPNRDVVEAAGINYEQFVSGLPVRLDVDYEAPRRGIPA